MEAKGKEAFFALEPLEANCKLTLGDGEGVPQVELAVHVGVGEGHHVPAQQLVAHTELSQNLTFPPAFLLIHRQERLLQIFSTCPNSVGILLQCSSRTQP